MGDKRIVFSPLQNWAFNSTFFSWLVLIDAISSFYVWYTEILKLKLQCICPVSAVTFYVSTQNRYKLNKYYRCKRSQVGTQPDPDTAKELEELKVGGDACICTLELYQWITHGYWYEWGFYGAVIHSIKSKSSSGHVTVGLNPPRPKQRSPTLMDLYANICEHWFTTLTFW